MMNDYGISQDFMTLFCDNRSAMIMAKNSVFPSWTKHIDIRHHYPSMASSSGKPSKAQQLLEATFTGNLTLLKELTEELDDGKGKAKVITSIKTEHGESVLHLAARNGYIDICKYLISDLGVPIDTKDAKGATALLLAYVKGHKATVVYLLEKAANPNISDVCGSTPLHYAAFEGHEEFLRYLLSKGADVDAFSPSGTPLQRAALRGQQGAIKILLDHHANPNLTFHGCFTALLNSIITKSLHSVELLLQVKQSYAKKTRIANKAGADPNAASRGVTPLELAVSNEETDMVRCLLKAGANPNVTSVGGETPVEISVRTGNTEAFQILFPVTSPIPTYSDWSYGGILKHTNSEEGKIQMAQQNEKFKSEGNKDFQRKDYLTAIFWYSKISNSISCGYPFSHHIELLARESMSYVLKYKSFRAPRRKDSRELDSEIERLTLSQIPSRYCSWREVSIEEKNKLWEDIKKKFSLCDSLKRGCLSKAAETWKKMKYSISTENRDHTNNISLPLAPNPSEIEGPSNNSSEIEGPSNNLPESVNCKILGFGGEVIGYGIKTPTGTMGVVHGHQLDDTEVKVLIMKVVDPTYPTWRKAQGGAETLGERAEGGFVYWHKDLLAPMNNYDE